MTSIKKEVEDGPAADEFLAELAACEAAAGNEETARHLDAIRALLQHVLGYEHGDMGIDLQRVTTERDQLRGVVGRARGELTEARSHLDTALGDTDLNEETDGEIGFKALNRAIAILDSTKVK